MRTSEDNRFDAAAFYRALALVVEARAVSWRQVAQETAMTPSSLTRFAQGSSLDSASLAKLAAWSGLNPAEFVSLEDGEEADSAAIRSIRTALRADPHLEREVASALEAILCVAYRSLIRSGHTPRTPGRRRRRFDVHSLAAPVEVRADDA